MDTENELRCSITSSTVKTVQQERNLVVARVDVTLKTGDRNGLVY